MGINIDAAGHRRDPETLTARKELALSMLRDGKRNIDIVDACQAQFNGMGISGSLLHSLRRKLALEAKRKARAERQLAAEDGAFVATRPPTLTAAGTAAAFALEVVRQGGRCVMHPDGRVEVFAGVL